MSTDKEDKWIQRSWLMQHYADSLSALRAAQKNTPRVDIEQAMIIIQTRFNEINPQGTQYINVKTGKVVQ